MGLLAHFEGDSHFLCGRPHQQLEAEQSRPETEQTHSEILIRGFFNEILIPFTEKGITGVRLSVKRHILGEGGWKWWRDERGPPAECSVSLKTGKLSAQGFCSRRFVTRALLKLQENREDLNSMLSEHAQTHRHANGVRRWLLGNIISRRRARRDSVRTQLSVLSDADGIV